MNSEDCIFCTIKNSERKLWQNDSFFIFLDNFPVNPGHMLVVPINHTLSLLDLSDDAWMDLNKAIKHAHVILEKLNLTEVYTQMLKTADNPKSQEYITTALGQLERDNKPSGFNYGVNDGVSAGRTVHHLHWHIIPRYDNDAADPRGGVRGVIPQRQNYRA